MVSSQKAGKTKKSKASTRFPAKSNQNWNQSSYSSVYGQNNSNNYRPNHNSRQYNYNNRPPLRPAGNKTTLNNNNYQNNPKRSQYQQYQSPQILQQQQYQQQLQQQYQQQQNLQSQQQQSNRSNMLRSSSNFGGDNYSSESWRNVESSSTDHSATFSMPRDLREKLNANKIKQEKNDEPIKAKNPTKPDSDALKSRIISEMNNAIQSNSIVPKQKVKESVPIIDLTDSKKVQAVPQNQQQQQQKLSISNRLTRQDSNNSSAMTRGTSDRKVISQNGSNLTVINNNTLYQVSHGFFLKN